MNEKYNLKLLIIINDPIELSDLFRRASEATIEELELSPPEIRIGNATPGSLSITTGVPGYRFQKIINGYDLVIFNLVYSDLKRGGFQVEMSNTYNLELSQEIYSKLNDFIHKLGYTDVFAYEVGINEIINDINYKEFTGLNNLETMKAPKYASLRILDGDTGSNDLREEFITDIKIEKLAQPVKSQVSCVSRTKDFHSDIIKKILDDLDKIIESMR
jgi:hypothetical protein